MKVISNKDGDLLSQFDNINENDIAVLEKLADLALRNKCTQHQKLLTNNYTDANKSKIKRFFQLEDASGFCKSFKKVTKKLGFYLLFKTGNLQDIMYTSMADDKNVTIKSLYLSIPNLCSVCRNKIRV